MRKTKPKKRIILPDPKFGEILVTKFVNNMMVNGKKQVSMNIFYKAIEIVSQKTKNDGLNVFKEALNNITPQVEVCSRRIGGATLQIPTEIRPARKQSIAMKNLISFSKKRNEKKMENKLAGEIIAAYKSEGGAFKRKEDIHKMAEANKAFSHFRF